MYFRQKASENAFRKSFCSYLFAATSGRPIFITHKLMRDKIFGTQASKFAAIRRSAVKKPRDGNNP
jgi:hypothetical protein